MAGLWLYAAWCPRGRPSGQPGWGSLGPATDLQRRGEALLPPGAQPVAHTGHMGDVQLSVRSKAQGATARTSLPGTSQQEASPGRMTKAGLELGDCRQGPAEREAGGQSGTHKDRSRWLQDAVTGGEDGRCGVWGRGGSWGSSSGASGRNQPCPLLDCHPEKPIRTSDLWDGLWSFVMSAVE